jgi:hypothetical protein
MISGGILLLPSQIMASTGRHAVTSYKTTKT